MMATDCHSEVRYPWEDLNEEGVLLCSTKRKANEGALEGKECCQTFLGFGNALHGLRPQVRVRNLCLYSKEESGGQGGYGEVWRERNDETAEGRVLRWQGRLAL